jgi:hypothetical protein
LLIIIFLIIIFLSSISFCNIIFRIILQDCNFLSLDDEKVIEQFNKKSFDTIALVDSNSCFDVKRNSNSIDLLKKFLERWDIFTRHKKFVFLKGGFEEWKKFCPSMVKNRIKKESVTKNVSFFYLIIMEIFYFETTAFLISNCNKIYGPRI